MNEKEFKKVISDIKIEVKEIFKKSFTTKTFIFRGLYLGNDVLCKIIGNENHLKALNLIREARANEKFSDLAGVKEVVSKTKTISFGRNENYTWLIRQYFEGDSLSGYNSKKKGLFGYDHIQEKYLNQREFILKEVYQSILSIRKIQFSKTEEQFFLPRFEKDLNNYKPENIAKGLNISLQSQLMFYDSIKKDFWKKNICGCMGDMVPANIVITNSSQVIVTDFEWLSSDHYITDVVFFWLFLWAYPDWQKSWYDLTVKNEKDQVYFRAEIIRHIIAWYKNLFIPGEKVSPALKEKRKIFANHIWSRYLVAAGQSLEAILNVK